MAEWGRKRLDKEVHPLALQKTKVTFNNFVRVKEFSEQHPSAFFKIQSSIEENETFSDCSSSNSFSIQDHRVKHSIIYLPSTSSDTSTISTEEGIETWVEDKSIDDEQDDIRKPELVVKECEICPEDELEDDIDSEDEIAVQECDANPECENCAGSEELQMLKDEEQVPIANKAQSFKIKWSFKRKKKKKLRLVVPQRTRKFLFLGDMNCGKSNLITTYCKDRFFERYHPTILHFCLSDTKIMGRKFDIIMADTSGRDDFKPLRQCAYFKTDVAILCYSAEDRNTLERIKSYWLPELKEYAPHCPFLLVETKKDIREEQEDKKLLLESEGKTETSEYHRICKDLEERIVPGGVGACLARELGAERFYSTSARYRAGTRKMVQNATAVAIKKSRRKRQT